MKALSIAATGMDAQQTRVAVISNNLANMNTTAYAARRAEFADLHYQTVRPSGASAGADGSIVPEGVNLGLGVRTMAVSMQMTPGTLLNTANELDVAIEGAGFFQVDLPTGETVFTRAGNFKRTAEGELVNSDGFRLTDGIAIPQEARSVTINAEGEVFATFANQPQAQQLGLLTLVTFTNEKGLEPIGGTLYRQTEASGQPVAGQAGQNGVGTLRQGYLEESNVDVVAQIAELIEAQRGYELNSKVISAADQMYASATQIR
ncbi:MAG: flagellar basal-body rod protein FlgG [Pseudomonadota bacterium]